jgi:hypothetical protein
MEKPCKRGASEYMRNYHWSIVVVGGGILNRQKSIQTADRKKTLKKLFKSVAL